MDLLALSQVIQPVEPDEKPESSSKPRIEDPATWDAIFEVLEEEE